MDNSIFTQFDDGDLNGIDDMGDEDLVNADLQTDFSGGDFLSEDNPDIPEPLQDITYLDTNNDGVEDMVITGIDTDGDGIIDAGQAAFYQDLNGDGYLETLTTGIDNNSDGLIDAWADQTDLNMDGAIDLYSEHSILDTNGDGLPDTAVDHYDTNLDGFMDIRSAATDTDGDGILDHQEILSDTDGDHILDNFQEINYFDGDNDGIIDTVSYSQDIGNDGFVEISSSGYDFDHDGILDSFGSDSNPDIGYGVTYGDNFDPSDANIDWETISGDPSSDMQNWHMQTHSDTCAVVCQEFVLEEQLGIDVSEDELRDMAMENGWYSDGGGTPAEHVGDLLEAYGLDVEKNTGASIEDIQNCLENGGSVIVGVDADEIWTRSQDFVNDELLNDSPFAPGGDANHAVEVIGIDSSDPDNVMVILNDPGSPGGCGSMLPLDEFMSAWDDSGNLLVTANK